jgi:LCP family protein required for cell wall assembly
MDNFRRRTPTHASGKAMDGFFARPAHGTPSSSHARVRPTPKTEIPTRRVDDFTRAEGFHAPIRRNIQPGNGPRRSPLRSGLATSIDMELPEEGKASKHKKTGLKLTRKQLFRKWAIRTSIASVILVVVGGGLFIGKGYFTFRKVFQGGSTAAALSSNVDPTLLKGEGDGRVNILMLGVGGAHHDGGDLTDTMMIASIDPVNNQAALLSIPRDLWTKMPNNYVGNYQKINAAYESGKYKYLGKQDITNKDHKAILAGFEGTDSVVERVTGVPIHYNMLVDFQAFSQAVDTVGGVTINAPERLWDPTMAWENKYNPLLAVQGINNFDGKHALMYARSRETSSDFARGERQRALLVAIKEKAANLGTLTNPLKLSSLMSAFGDNVQSDVSITDMTRMASIMKKIPSSQIQSVGLTDGTNSFVTTGNINGMSVVMPKAGLEDYSKIQEFIRSKLKDGYIAKENATISIFNGSGVAGLATTKADELKSYGYNVGTVTNAPTEDYTQTKIIDLSNGTKKYTINYLKNRLGVSSVDKQLPAGIVATGANIVIILGSDAAQN